MTRIRWVSIGISEIQEAVVAAPFGKLGIQVAGDAVWKIEFLPPDRKEKPQSTRLIEQAVNQLCDYFNDPEAPFSLPLVCKGTEFTNKVWEKLLMIRPGSVRTYGSLAKSLSTSPRAIGAACRANDYPIIIPCHRVTAATGIGGFSGSLSEHKLSIKRWLLSHEHQMPKV